MPLKVTLSAWLYQPLESGERAGVAVTTRPRLVVAEAVGARGALVPRTVAAGAVDRGVGAVGARVADLRAGLDAGGGVGACEADREVVVVPAGAIG